MQSGAGILGNCQGYILAETEIPMSSIAKGHTMNTQGKQMTTVWAVVYENESFHKLLLRSLYIGPALMR